MSRRRFDQSTPRPHGKPGWSAGQRGKKEAASTEARRAEPGTESGVTESATAPSAARERRSGARGSDARRYPWEDDPDYVPGARSRRLPPLPRDHPARAEEERSESAHWDDEHPGPGCSGRSESSDTRDEPRPGPRKLTVTRVAAWRSRDLTQRAMRLFFSAAQADGAGQSGLARFTYAVMFNYAVDAAMAVALANTLFFSAATAESKDKVALYLLITAAPFAVIAPVIGPALDRIQQGRRYALAASFLCRVVLAAVMALNFNSWALYPAALGCMVLSKSFGVLKAALTPRVLPDTITLTKANSRLTMFGLAAGGVFGAVASGCAYVFDSQGALWFMAALAAVGTAVCLRIPGWVESTEGEVPATLHDDGRRQRQPLSAHTVLALWGNAGIRLLTGFLTLFAAFVIKHTTQHEPIIQLVLLGVVGGAAGAGSFLGNGAGARMHFGKPDRIILGCLGATTAASACAALLSGVAMAAVVGLVGGTASALAKVCLDAVVQRDMPEKSRASTFGRSETVLQLSWVFGGALGVLLPPSYWLGFTVITALLLLVFAHTALLSTGRGLLPTGFRRSRVTTPGGTRSHAKP